MPKRCDAQHPCLTCQKAGKQDDCVFEQISPTKQKPRRRPIPYILSHSSRSPHDHQSHSTDGGQPSTLPPGYISDSPVLLKLPLRRTPSPRPSQIDYLLSKPSISLCDFPSIFAPRDSALIPDPFIPLSLSDVADPYAFALSDVSMDDLNMNL